MLPLGGAAAAVAEGVGETEGKSLAVGTSQQPRRKRPPTHPGCCPPRPAPANRKAQLPGPALWPPPSLEATHHFPSGRQQSLPFPRAPLRMAPRPPPFHLQRLAEPPPRINATVAGRHVTADGRWCGSNLAGTRVSLDSCAFQERTLCLTGSGQLYQNVLLKFKIQ